MKFFIVFLLLNYAVFSSVFARASDFSTVPETSSQWDNANLSVWKVKNFGGRATSFFLGKKLVVTNFHVVSSMLKKGTVEDMSLSQEGNPSILQVKRIVALSGLYDLALLETKEEVIHYLSLRKNPMESDESLFIPGYPQGTFKIMRKTGSVFHEDSYHYAFPVNHLDLSGASGSPVLDDERQIVGVAHQSIDNILIAIKTNHLNRFVAGNIGLSCLDFADPKICVKKEIENLEELAEQGHVQAQYSLNDKYYKGEGVEKSLEKAVFWLIQSAEQGYAPAQNSLANMYYEGEGVEKDLEKAVFWWEQATEQGHAVAQHNLSFRYYKGEGVEKSLEKAVFWLTQAAEQGYAPSQDNLALRYYEGEGVEKDLEKAVFWWEQAAKQGHTRAQYNMAFKYYRGEGVERSLEQAIFWLKQAAEQGHAPSQFILAGRYYVGEGVEKSLKQAVFWLEQAAKQGHVKARSTLGMLKSQE